MAGEWADVLQYGESIRVDESVPYVLVDTDISQSHLVVYFTCDQILINTTNGHFFDVDD